MQNLDFCMQFLPIKFSTFYNKTLTQKIDDHNFNLGHHNLGDQITINEWSHDLWCTFINYDHVIWPLIYSKSDHDHLEVHMSYVIGQ